MNTYTDPKEIVWENLSKAHAMLRTASHAGNFSELSSEVIQNYLWALENHVQLALEAYQKIFNPEL